MDYPFHLENPLQHHHHLHNSSDDHHDKFTTLFHMESHHIIPSNSIDSGNSSVRLQIIYNINHFSIRFDPFLPYLAINYLDRFLPTQSVPAGKPWILRLIAISCVSLALKMRKTEYSATDIQNDGGGIIFDSQTIKRMELLILGALRWRMRLITPFAFVDFFVSLIKLKDQPSCQALQNRAAEIIFNAQIGLKCYEFKPSIVAGSALLLACYELFPVRFQCFSNAISSCSYVHKNDLYKCYNVIQKTVMDDRHNYVLVDTLSSSTTPVNLLDMRCTSIEIEIDTETETETETETTTKTVVEEINVSRTATDLRVEMGVKRRKIKCFGSKNSLQLSQGVVVSCMATPAVCCEHKRSGKIN